MFEGFLFGLAKSFTSIIMAVHAGSSTAGADSQDPGNAAIDPVYDALSTFGPPLLGLLAAVMALYGAIMGFSYAKAEDSGERDKAKKKLVYGLIGFGVVILLVAMLYMLRGTITGVTNDQIEALEKN